VIIHSKHSGKPSESLESVQLGHHTEVGTPDDPMDGAYRDGKSAKDAQFDVKKYGSRQYTSHRKALESVARRFDEPSSTN